MQQPNNKLLWWLLAGLLVVALLLGITQGAVRIQLSEMIHALKIYFTGSEEMTMGENVFLYLRLPRVLLVALGGATLAVSGVLMQGLFRNPIVEPGIMGTSAGAAFGASVVFVLSSGFSPAFKGMIGPLLTPMMAFVGAMMATLMVYYIAKQQKAVPVLSLILVGMAVNALCVSGTGFMSYLARDPQARSITFWNLGTFNGATWGQVLIVFLIGLCGMAIMMKYAKGLNALLLGEEEALYMGIEIGKMKRMLLLINTLLVAVLTSFVGVVGFVGLIVPHMLRLISGSDHRKLIPLSAMAGAILLILADLISRLLIAPAEIPIGVITSLVGAPVFILLLKRSVLKLNAEA